MFLKKKSRFLLITHKCGIHMATLSELQKKISFLFPFSEYFVKQCHYYNHILSKTIKKSAEDVVLKVVAA